MKTIRCLPGMLLFTLLLLPPAEGHADGAMELSKGQTVYVPAYSHISVATESGLFC